MREKLYIKISSLISKGVEKHCYFSALKIFCFETVQNFLAFLIVAVLEFSDGSISLVFVFLFIS